MQFLLTDAGPYMGLFKTLVTAYNYGGSKVSRLHYKHATDLPQANYSHYTDLSVLETSLSIVARVICVVLTSSTSVCCIEPALGEQQRLAASKHSRTQSVLLCLECTTKRWQRSSWMTTQSPISTEHRSLSTVVCTRLLSKVYRGMGQRQTSCGQNGLSTV